MMSIEARGAQYVLQNLAILQAFAEAFVITQPRPEALAWLRHVNRILVENERRDRKVVPLSPADRRWSEAEAAANRDASQYFRERILPSCVARIQNAPRR